MNNGVEYVGVYAVASMATDPTGNSLHSSATYLANVQSGGTLISTNKGATWSRIVTAATRQQLVVVLDTLSAEHGWSGPASVATAPGLVVANAMVVGGSGTPTVFVSRDGGASWTAATQPSSATGLTSPQPYFFEILDHGSVIVLFETARLTSAVFYSLDEGASWSTYNFTDATTVVGSWGRQHTCGILATTRVPWTCDPTWYPNGNRSGFIMQCYALNSDGLPQDSFDIGVTSSASGFSGSADGVSNQAVITMSNSLVGIVP